MKSYSIQVDQKDKIVYREFYGDLIIEEIGESWKEVLNNPDFGKKGFNLLSDYTKSTLQISASSLDSVLNFYNSHKDIFTGKKHAVIVSKPRQTAFSILFQQQHNHDIMAFNVFDDISSAKEWLKSKG